MSVPNHDEDHMNIGHKNQHTACRNHHPEPVFNDRKDVRRIANGEFVPIEATLKPLQIGVNLKESSIIDCDTTSSFS